MESSRLLLTPEELERARRYHRPLYIALLLDMTLRVVVLSLARFHARASDRGSTPLSKRTLLGTCPSLPNPRARSPDAASVTTEAAKADFHTVATLPPTCYQSLKPS